MKQIQYAYFIRSNDSEIQLILFFLRKFASICYMIWFWQDKLNPYIKTSNSHLCWFDFSNVTFLFDIFKVILLFIMIFDWMYKNIMFLFQYTKTTPNKQTNLIYKEQNAQLIECIRWTAHSIYLYIHLINSCWNAQLNGCTHFISTKQDCIYYL